MNETMDMAAFYRLFTRFFRPYWRATILVFLFYLVAGIIRGLEPLVFAPLIETFSFASAPAATSLSDLTLNNLAPSLIAFFGMDAGNRTAMIFLGVVAYLGMACAWSILTTAGFLILIRTRTRVSRDMIVELHRHILSQPLGFFHARHSGDFISRLTHDVQMTANSLDAIVRGVLQSVTEMFIYGLILFRTDALLSFAILGLGFSHFGITRLLANRARVSTGDAFDKRGEMSRRLLESIQGIRVIKSFAAERYEHNRILQVANELRRRTIRFKSALFYETPIRHIADSLLICLALVLSFYAMSHGRLQTGGFVLFVGLSMRALAPISQLAQQFLQLHSMVGGGGRVSEMFATRTTMSEGEREAPPLSGSIELRDVRFGYRPDREVLHGVNLTIRKGETVALVGPSGAGKTTLADLIVRLYDPTGGVIRYDGIDIRDFRQRSYRRNFGVVPQDPLLFHAPVREVVAFSRPMDEGLLEESLRAAIAWDFVKDLPEGVDTVAGERGAQLSGGQRQRIAIARAIYARPSILVLDEATSALDSESERALQDAIAGIVRNMTAVIIAHRFSTILHADRVVVMNRGLIEAVGTHETLLRDCPTYRYLYELQFADTAARAAGEEDERAGDGEEGDG